MEVNEIYNGDFMSNGLPDHCADLIVADPPYYKVKGDFDSVWDSLEDYLKDVERWSQELSRLLSYNGTLVWFGSWRNIAYCQTILDRSFHLINSCTVKKRNGIQGVLASPDTQRSFFTNDERFLIYENSSEDRDESLGGKAKNYYNTRLGLLKSQCVKPVIDYLNGERERAGFTVKQINEALGTFMASHWFTYKSQWELPTPEWYEKLRVLFNQGGARVPAEGLRVPAEGLRGAAEGLRGAAPPVRHGGEAVGCVRGDGGQWTVLQVGTSHGEGHEPHPYAGALPVASGSAGAGAIRRERHCLLCGCIAREEIHRLRDRPEVLGDSRQAAEDSSDDDNVTE